jgi:uncharacterized protein YbbC (DUF1343 family)
METGLDQIVSHSLACHRWGTVALLAHPASVDRELTHISEVLERAGVRPRIIFGPEHGYGGEAQDMIGVADARDARGVPVKSLYGESFADLSPADADLEGIDSVLIDLQDVGSRYYTFVWTALLVLRACAKRGVRVVVLDRPNPLGGAEIEGRLQDKGFLSFVGLEPIPIRHGLTIGEIVAWRAAVEGFADLVEVAPVRGLAREAHAPAWDRPMVMPSPNMPGYETALVYPGGCLVEGTNLSEGRGTTRPFEIVGAPFVDGVRLARELERTKLAGFRARPITFRPTFHKHAGRVCGGVQIHVTDARAFRPVATYTALIALAQREAPEAFRFRTERYEFVDDIPAIDLLTGSADTRERIVAGEEPLRIAEALSETGAAERAIVDEARQAHKKPMPAAAPR